MPDHRVSQGECLSSIADRYGFFWQTLWNRPENARLQELGRHPNALHPGDVVFIPEKRMASFIRPTGARHTFKKRGIPVKLRMQLMWDGAPRAGEPYKLTVGDVVLEGALNGEGFIETNIPPGAPRGTLVVGEGSRRRTYTLALGHLDPVETVSGVQARLRNLGYPCEVTGSLDDATRAALRSFQTRAGLAVTGADDDATRSRLREAHDEG